MRLTFDGTGQQSDYLADIGLTKTKTPPLKTGGPLKSPPIEPPLNRNPRKHDVVSWRHDGRLDTQRFETKEAAQEYGRSLCWAIYYQWVLMTGREFVEKHQIAIPQGMGLEDNGLPYKITS